MKQKVLLLIVFGVFCAQVFPQKKERKVESDGYEWYLIEITSNGKTLYGAEDCNGNVIVPTEYDFMHYSARYDNLSLLRGFNPRKGGSEAWYHMNGKCVIPYSRGYTEIYKDDDVLDRFGTYYSFVTPNGGGICDKNGKEIVAVKQKGLTHIDIKSTLTRYTLGRDNYYLILTVKMNGEYLYGIADTNGQIIEEPKHKELGTAVDIAKRRLTTTTNPLKNNKHDTLVEIERHTNGKYTINGITYYVVKEKGKRGIMDGSGKWIIPYNENYTFMKPIGGSYIKTKEGNNSYFGIMTFDGKVIVPTSRGYTSIDDFDSNKKTFGFTKKGYKGVCNAQGIEISTTRLAPTADDIRENGGYSSVVSMNNGSTKYYKVSKGGRYGLTDAEGKEIVPTEMEALESAGTGYLRYKLNGFWGLMNFTGKVLVDTDRGYTSIGEFKSFNKRFAYTMNGYKGECDATGRQISKIKVETSKQNTSVASSSGSSSSSSSTSSSSSSSSSSNSGNKTTTVVVEHHRDPIPVQEWVQCTACWGSGTCPDCAGSGTKYVGNSLKRCWRCGGRGKCSSCSGQGGRYYTVYK